MDQMLEGILRAAVQAGASDIHLKTDAAIMFRINGTLTPIEAPLPGEEWLESVLAQIVPPQLAPALERDHEADFAFAPAGLGRFRTNVFQQRGRWTIAMRLVKTEIRSFEELNLPAGVQRIAETPRGIVLIAGAIGSGKSTTLAAIVEQINRTARKHIITLEDPIEFLFEDKLSVIEQREVGIDTSSFSSGLRHVLRQDPDVIVIGEMRDTASAAAAMSAANIGHLVIATLHTGDAPKSVQRILEFFPAEQREYARRLFADTLHAVLCQRLIRSDSSGTLPAVEILLNNGGVAKLILDDRIDKLTGAMELGTGEGMQTFDQALQQLVASGRITRQEALAHAANPDALRMAFQGVVLSESRRILGSRE